MSVPAVLRSMTGFARVTHADAGLEFEIEARSVNHRFLEVSLKAPRAYTAHEREIKAAFQRVHRRGRIDVSITRRLIARDTTAISEQSESFDRLVKSFTAACKRYGAGVEGLSAFIGQLVLREQAYPDELIAPSDDEVAQLLATVERASEGLATMREYEGAALVLDVRKRMERLEVIRGEIARGSAATPAKIKQTLESRVALLAPEVRGDSQRLALEVALLADKVDVSEELTRLEAHLEHFSATLKGHTDSVGRKLDFIVQEIGRELNTIGSKAQDASIQGLVVDAKAEMERVREQIQNVE